MVLNDNAIQKVTEWLKSRVTSAHCEMHQSNNGLYLVVSKSECRFTCFSVECEKLSILRFKSSSDLT